MKEPMLDKLRKSFGSPLARDQISHGSSAMKAAAAGEMRNRREPRGNAMTAASMADKAKAMPWFVVNTQPAARGIATREAALACAGTSAQEMMASVRTRPVANMQVNGSPPIPVANTANVAVAPNATTP